MGPAGKLETVITYLQMKSPPVGPPPPTPAMPHAILLARPMTVSFYRYLYGTVGEALLWWERRVLNDDDLAARIGAEGVDIFVLYVSGVPAGYYELSEPAPGGDIELAYFGLIPDFIGRGFGAYLLRCAIDEAWRRGPNRLWVHTCTLDHPNALPFYQRAGFEVFDQKIEIIDDPRARGIIPPSQ